MADPDETKKELVPARGPVHYDLLGMSDGNFDLLCHRLIRLEHSGVEKPAETNDGGADALLPMAGGGYEHAWQAKHFPKAISWTECRKSFADATENYKPEAYTFFFPRDLTKREQQTFDKHFRPKGATVPVDYINGAEIQARLTESPEGRTIAKHFFKDDGEVLEQIKRAAIAKGELDTPGDALERMRPIGEYLASEDPYFSYSASVYKEGGSAETPHPEGTVMSVAESDEDGLTSRIDVVPDDPEAIELYGPKGKLSFPPEVYREAAEALARGEEFTAKGVGITWEQLPPAFSEQLGKAVEAEVTIGPAARPPPAPWSARVDVEVGASKANVDLDLKPADPPEGWDGCLQGYFAGMTMRLFFRAVGDGGESTIKYQYSLNSHPAREQLRALRFMDLIALEGGTMRISDRARSDREVTLATGAPEDSQRLEALTAFLELIVEIEDWTGEQIPVSPEKFTNEHFNWAAVVVSAIRRGGFHINFEQLELAIDPERFAELGEGGPLVIERTMGVKVLDHPISFGRTRINIARYGFEKVGNDSDGRPLVRIFPPDEEASKLLEIISKPVKTKRPPPPPRKKKGRGGRDRSRRKGGR